MVYERLKKKLLNSLTSVEGGRIGKKKKGMRRVRDVSVSNSRKMMERMKGRGNMKPWFLFTARLDAGAYSVCTSLISPIDGSSITMNWSLAIGCVRLANRPRARNTRNTYPSASRCSSALLIVLGTKSSALLIVLGTKSVLFT